MNLGVLIRVAIISAWLFYFVRRERVAGYLYLIPGGMIHVRRKQVYRRSKGLMVWCADSRTLHVLDSGPNKNLSFPVTPPEAMVAMRAWLSPVPGPSDELLQSFLGDA